MTGQQIGLKLRGFNNLLIQGFKLLLILISRSGLSCSIPALLPELLAQEHFEHSFLHVQAVLCLVKNR
jgi:hypothetical protein